MDEFGYFRAVAASPRVTVANPDANVSAMIDLLRQIVPSRPDLVVFPELAITGYTCGDLFQQETLLEAARRGLARFCEESATQTEAVLVVGLPLRSGHDLYNVAAVVRRGRLLGLVPKQHIPNYKEFYERRWFQPARPNMTRSFEGGSGEPVLLSARQIFVDERDERCAIGVEICEDLWVPNPPSGHLAESGATLLVNLSASNELTTKADYRRSLVAGQSARCMAGYVYASSGVTESTTDLVFSGHQLIAENGLLLAESHRFRREGEWISADIDLGRLMADRQQSNTFGDSSRRRRITRVDLGSMRRDRHADLRRPVPPHPFVPTENERLGERCREIFAIQVAALAKRLESARITKVAIGVSGGLDSTLALLVLAKTCDELGLPRSMVHGITMPGFGTSDRTKSNAEALMRDLGITAEAIDIRQLCLDTFLSLGHHPFGIDLSGMTLDQFTDTLQHRPVDRQEDLVFENVQARLRTMILMNRGFVVGTGDLSELALGWTTYNADHMSMYNPNVGIPKTLVRFLVRWVAEHEHEYPTRQTLLSIADTEISPELLPPHRDGRIQSTEGTIGPYELHDFFLYHLLRFGFTPAKILHLASHARFDGTYSAEQRHHWLGVFLRRFFAHQFKRSCLPDGPKVGTISLSPRGDWRMPSDADVSAWLADGKSES